MNIPQTELRTGCLYFTHIVYKAHKNRTEFKLKLLSIYRTSQFSCFEATFICPCPLYDRLLVSPWSDWRPSSTLSARSSMSPRKPCPSSLPLWDLPGQAEAGQLHSLWRGQDIVINILLETSKLSAEHELQFHLIYWFIVIMFFSLCQVFTVTRALASIMYLSCSHVLKDITALKEPAMPLSFLVPLEATTQKRAWSA